MSPFEAEVAAYVERLNESAQALIEAGKNPLYKVFGYSPPGPAHARIFCENGPGRSSRAFFSRDGKIRRSDSWKKPGRILGEHTDPRVFDYILQGRAAL